MREKIEIPEQCPSCNSSLLIERSADLGTYQLFCTNPECGAKVGRQIIHFCKVLGIKGLGEQTIAKLNLSSITDIYRLTEVGIANKLSSEKLAAKVYEQIQASTNATVSKVLVSFGIPLIGDSAAEKLFKVANSIDDVTTEVCGKAGLGEKATQNLMRFLNTEFKEIRNDLPFSYGSNREVGTGNSNGKFICITGKLRSYKSKAEATIILENLGYTVTDSVTKSTNYLVDEENKGSSKRVKADSMGVVVITNLMNFIQEEIHDSR